MRVLGLPIVTPDLAGRVAADLGALARAARRTPDQLDRLLTIGEEIVAIGQRVLELGERIDRRAELILALGERIDARAEALQTLGEQMDARGAEIVDSAGRVAETGNELVTVLPTLQRAIEMATPLEGAIDRVGRFVDRLPGGQRRRAADSPVSSTAPPDPPLDRPEPPDDPALGRS